MISTNNDPMGAFGVFLTAMSQSQKGLINNLLKPGQNNSVKNKETQSEKGLINNLIKPGQTNSVKNGKYGLDILA
jgi:hypothetical protein